MRWWKMLGLAGLAGVAATGVVIVRAERRRRSHTPEEIRERLHARLAEAAQTESVTTPIHDTGSDSIRRLPHRLWWRRIRLPGRLSRSKTRFRPVT